MLEESVFELDTIFDNIADMISQQAQQKNLQIQFSVDSTVPRRLVGDPLRLGQILINLASNALKFTEQGTISIKCSAQKSNEKDITLCFIVSDTGIGMSEEVLTRIFQAFSQADNSTTRRFGGTGLGLVISKHLAELMKGSIDIASQPGAGTTVTVTVNLRLPDSDEVDTAPHVRRELNNVSILVVDDDETARHTMNEMLKRMHMRPTIVESAEAALSKIRNMDPNDPFELVLMDWKLPGLNGAEATRQILDMNLPSPPAIIMITAYGRGEVQHYAQTSGVDAFLHKPVTPSLLYNTIQDSLIRHSPDFQNSDSTMPSNTNRSLTDSDIDDISLGGSRILLVEDNVINQQIAVELLTSKDAQVDVANNGEEAINKIMATVEKNAEPYNLVLMDLQMPVMDGFEATHSIRADSRFDGLPIIAMTAHAMREEYDRCHDCGMNDHISKPIEVKSFFKIIMHWLDKNDSVKTNKKMPEAPAKPAQGQNQEDLSCALPGIDVSGALKRVGGNTQLYKKMLTKFRQTYSDTSNELTNLIANKKYEDAILLAHSIKGLSGNLGITDLFSAAEQLEKYLRADSDSAELQTLLANFTEKLHTCIEIIKNANIEEVVEPPKQNLNADAQNIDPEKVNMLRKLLASSDANAQALFETLIPEFEKFVPEGILGKIKMEVENFEFDEALALLEKVLPQLDQ